MPTGVYPRKPLAERFWAKVNKAGTVPSHCPELGPCWLWTAAGGAYGFIMNGRKTVLAHRYAWEQINGPIPDGLWVLHHCDTPRCVNAERHLFLGTNSDNIKDAYAKGRSPSGDRHYTRLEPEKALRGEKNGQSKLTAEQVREIRLRLPYETHSAIARDYGVSSAAIFLIHSGKNWRHST